MRLLTESERSPQARLYSHFSHIYVEKNLAGTKRAESIINKFPKANVIEINHYKDIFNRKNQSFSAQKASQSLILGEKHADLVYKGAPFCQDFGNSEFYYTSLVMGCVYDCEYCYLRGMYPGGNMVAFLNAEDFLDEVKKVSCGKKIFLCISYDTDLAAMESVFGFCALWHSFAEKNRNITIELRTKCAELRFLKNLSPLENYIIALTLSPEKNAVRYEKKVPSLEKRLEAGRMTAELGHPLRLSFDPILKTDNFDKTYEGFIQKCFSSLPADKIKDIGFGAFRISPSYLKAMRKNYPSSSIAFYPYELQDGAYSYEKTERDYMTSKLMKYIEKYINNDKIYLWDT